MAYLPPRSAIVLAAALLVPGGRAVAQGNGPLAEALFRHGRQLMDQGKVAEACEKFGASQRADPALGTLLNLAACHEREGRTATAWAEFSDAAAEAARVSDRSRESFAKTHLEALERSLYRLAIEVPEPVPGLTVGLDGQTLARAAWGTPIPVDPGRREIEASAPGHRPFQESLDVPAQAGERHFRIPLLALSPAVVTAAVRTEPAASRSGRVVGWSLVGAGLVGAGAGSVLALIARQKLNDSRPLCPGNVCTHQGFELNAAAGRAATASTASFTVALVAAATGALLLYFSRHK